MSININKNKETVSIADLKRLAEKYPNMTVKEFIEGYDKKCLDSKSIYINLNKDPEKESFIEVIKYKGMSSYGCCDMACLGKGDIGCRECIFADRFGTVYTNPIKYVSLLELEESGRVKYE